MQLYDTMSQKCVTRQEALLHSAKLKDLKFSYTGKTLKTHIHEQENIG